MDRHKEGPFTIAGAVATLAAVLLTVVGALQPSARLVLGGVLIGFSLAAGAALIYLRRLRRDPERLQNKLPTFLTPLLPLLGFGLGMFLLVVPTFMTLPGDTQSSGSKQAAGSTPASNYSPSTGPLTSTTSSSPSSAPASPTTAAGQARVRFEGQVRLADGIGSDLDHQPPTPGGGEDLQLDFSRGAMISETPGILVALWPKPMAPTPGDCTTQVSTQSQHEIPAQVGIQFCIRTSEGRIAYASVTSAEQDPPHTVQLDVKVWETTR